MNADLALGFLAGMPVGALLLIALGAVGSEIRNQRVRERYLDDCSKLRTARLVRALRGAVQ